MKKLFVIFFLFSINLSAQLKITDERTGIPIIFTVSPDCFPESWRGGKINGKAASLDSNEVERTATMIKKAMAKYPVEMLTKNLKIIYAFKSINFFGQNYGGTNSTYNLYIANSGRFNGYTDEYIEKTFHHEFSSILYRNYPTFLNATEWKNNNAMAYGNGGVNALKEKKTSQDLDTALCAKGFIHQYGTSDMENDINSFAENLFLSYQPFWNAVNTYPRLKNKTAQLIAFYNKINKVFTVEYFMTFKQKETRD